MGWKAVRNVFSCSVCSIRSLVRWTASTRAVWGRSALQAPSNPALVPWTAGRSCPDTSIHIWVPSRCRHLTTTPSQQEPSGARTVSTDWRALARSSRSITMLAGCPSSSDGAYPRSSSEALLENVNVRASSTAHHHSRRGCSTASIRSESPRALDRSPRRALLSRQAV